MAIEKITIYTVDDAVMWLVQVEASIKAARSLYKQANYNELAIDSDTRQEIMMAIEEKGVALSKLKGDILRHMDMRVYPIICDRV